jgi:hypothetical protein
MFRSLKLHSDLGAKRSRANKPRIEALENRWLPNATTISGFVYSDSNNSGIYAAGEQGIGGNTIQLENANGQVINTTTTDANGHYVFTTDNTATTQPQTKEFDANFPAQVTNWSGTQSVPQFDPALGTLTGVVVISKASLTSDIQVQSLDSAASHVTGNVTGKATLTVGSNGAVAPLVTDLATAEDVDLPAYDNAGLFQGGANHDFGSKTAQNSSEISLTSTNADLSQFIGAGQIQLTEGVVATSSAAGPANLLTKVNSTADGAVRIIYHYTPSNTLKPGQYIVTEPYTPAGYFDGKNTADNIHVLPPIPKNTIPVTLTAQNDSTTNNFGKLVPANLSGFVYVDNANTGVHATAAAGIPGSQGIGGVTLNLSGIDDLGTLHNQNTVTAADGSYSFTSLRPGGYTITEPQQPAGYLDGKTTVGSQGGATQGVDTIAGIPLAQGVNGTDNNFGKLQPAQVGGFVYYDKNNNGVRDVGDDGIANVTVNLSGVNLQGQEIMRSVQTNADGSYSFGQLYPGSYSLADVQPTGYVAGVNSLGNLGGTKDTTHLFVTLAGNAVGTDYNFGNTLPPTNPPAPPPTPPPTPAPKPPPAIESQQSPPAELSKRMFVGGDWTRWV